MMCLSTRCASQLVVLFDELCVSLLCFSVSCTSQLVVLFGKLHVPACFVCRRDARPSLLCCSVSCTSQIVVFVGELRVPNCCVCRRVARPSLLYYSVSCVSQLVVFVDELRVPAGSVYLWLSTSRGPLLSEVWCMAWLHTPHAGAETSPCAPSFGIHTGHVRHDAG